VLLVDRRPHIGGNAFDTYDENGILIHPYGPHIFHTNSKRVFAYLSRFTDWRFYEHKVLLEVGAKLYSLPINRLTLNALYNLDLDEAGAVAHFERARQLDPRNAAVIWNLGETYSCLRRYDEANRLFEEGLKINPNAHFFSLLIAANTFKKDGDLSALKDALKRMPADFNPGGAVTTVAVRVALMERDYTKATKLLDTSGMGEMNDGGIGGMAGAIDGYTFPRTWYEGIIAQRRGDAAASKRAFEAARITIEEDARICASDEKSICLLGLIDAALGRKEDALAEARRATEVLPIEEDAFDGPILTTNLAVVYTQTGELDLAITELERLTQLPNGPTSGMLKVEPEWDPLRGDPRFEALIR